MCWIILLFSLSLNFNSVLFSCSFIEGIIWSCTLLSDSFGSTNHQTRKVYKLFTSPCEQRPPNIWLCDAHCDCSIMQETLQSRQQWQIHISDLPQRIHLEISRTSWVWALYVMEGFQCMELTIVNGTVESFWVRIKGQTNNVDSSWESTVDFLARKTMKINYSLRNWGTLPSQLPLYSWHNSDQKTPKKPKWKLYGTGA